MKFEWKPRDDYYDAIISAPDYGGYAIGYCVVQAYLHLCK